MVLLLLDLLTEGRRLVTLGEGEAVPGSNGFFGVFHESCLLLDTDCGTLGCFGSASGRGSVLVGTYLVLLVE